MSAVISEKGVPRKRALSSRTEAAFFQLVNRIGRLNEPTPTQLETLARAYESTSDYLASASEFKGLLVEIHPHGSRQLGTMVRPLDAAREGFDVDAAARMDQVAWNKYGGQGGAEMLLRDLSTVMHRYAQAYGLKLIRDDRCITLEYADGLTVDYAPMIDRPSFLGEYGDTRAMIPDREFKQYDETNPRGYFRYFDRAASIRANFTSQFTLDGILKSEARTQITPLSNPDEVFERLLCRIVQLLKLHMKLYFNETPGLAELAPTSMLVTTLAANAYSVLAPMPHDSPLDLLLDITDSLLSQMTEQQQANGTRLWVLPNPSVPSENLAGGMTPLKQRAFLGWHQQARTDIDNIIDAIEAQQGRDAVMLQVQKAFGGRAVRALREQDAQAMQVSRALGSTKLFPAAVAAGAAVASISTPARGHTFFGK